MTSVRKTLKTLVWSAQKRSILGKFALKVTTKSAVFYQLLSGQICPKNCHEIPSTSADFSAILSLKIAQNLTFFFRNLSEALIWSRLCSKKNCGDSNVLSLWNPGCLVYDFLMKNLGFPRSPAAKVRCQGPPVSSRTYPWSSVEYVSDWLIESWFYWLSISLTMMSLVVKTLQCILICLLSYNLNYEKFFISTLFG